MLYKLNTSCLAHNAVVTAAVFAPNPTVIFKQLGSRKALLTPNIDTPGEGCTQLATLAMCSELDSYVLVTADFGGGIKVFVNKGKSVKSSTL